MTLAYSYLRFSTPGQAEGDSIRRQTTEQHNGRAGTIQPARFSYPPFLFSTEHAGHLVPVAPRSK